MKIYFYTLIFILAAACDGNQSTQSTQKNAISIDTLAVMGAEDQPFDYQFGDPFSVLTDAEGNIYIADKASLTVKVFSPKGELLRSFGGRGRGPGEFQWLSMMSPVGGDTLIFQDRGRLEFIYTTLQGTELSFHPVDLSSQINQYYPKSVKWHNDHSIGLMMHSAFEQYDPPRYERAMFYVYDKEFKQRKTTFFPYSSMGFPESDWFVWANFVFHPGSFDLSPEQQTLIYSPGIYTGRIYELTPSDSLAWQLNRVISTHPAHDPAYEIYSEARYESMRHIPGVNQISSGGAGGTFYARLYSVDAGVFYLSDGNIVQFFGEWQGGDKSLEEGNPLELFAQIISPQGDLLQQGKIMSVEFDGLPSLSLVNWKDEEDNFYLLNLSKHEVPTVIKFRLNLGE